MKFYVSNENGDWWTFEGTEGDTLAIISEADLKKQVTDLEELPDKLEQDIWESGKQINLSEIMAGN